ncbi:MAG: F420-dependent NADP oxidoreductase [Flavobacteriaceae bacterium]|nr:F420-dependent NADP oxidoreductase [Flavobacteriaceae bacterium]
MIRIVILGFGNVGQHLFKAFSNASEIEVIQVYNRSEIDIFEENPTNFTSDITNLKEADIYVIAVPDDAIKNVSETIPVNSKLVVHTSGSVMMEDLSNKNRKGVFYPLQSFSKNKAIDFSEIPICVEASDASDLILLKKIGNKISNNVSEISSEERKKLHLSAVIVNNFVNYLYQVGSDLLSEADLSFDLLKPLIKETALKIEKLTPFEAQTGPAKRNDKKTIEKQLHLLKDSPHQKLYAEMTEAILREYHKED